MTVAAKFCYFLLLCTSLITATVTAEQLSFSKKLNGDVYVFNYQWLDHEKQQQQMNFSLSKAALFNRFREFKTYKPTFAQKAILRRLKKQVQQQPFADVQVTFNRNNGKTSIDIKGTDQQKINQAYDKLVQLEKQTTQQYLQDNYYHSYINHDQVVGIKPDHARIANLSVTDLKVLKPLILEKVSIKNIRKASNFTLSFVQSIPYSTLESRITSSGAGFNPPLKLLWENQGDCDSKMTLTAALLRALMPRIEMVLVYIDRHAFIGLAIPSQGNDVSIEHNGIHYVLAEPTGPALLPLGSLAPASELAINQGHYTVESYSAEPVKKEDLPKESATNESARSAEEVTENNE